MGHRIREAMRDGSPDILGGNGSTVEVDETYWGGKKRKTKKARGYQHKEKILTLVERDGRARSFHVPAVNAKTLMPILKEQIAQDTHVMTDEAPHYVNIKKFLKMEHRPLAPRTEGSSRFPHHPGGR